MGRIRTGWHAFAERVAWTPPTRAEVGAVARAGVAAALAWMLAVALTDVEAPVLAPLAALITVRVSVHASIRSAIERSAAVVLGVLVAVAIGNTLGLNTLTVGLLTSGSLAFALLVLRLPRPAATQIPVSALVVMAALAAGEQSYARERAFDTVLGAAVGVVVSLALPASRRDDARGAMRQLATVVGDELDAMGEGLSATWSTSQTAAWRHTARLTRQRLVEQMTEAVGNGREAAHWNIRDRPHTAELGLYEDVMPRLERTAIGAWAIARGLEDHAQLTGGEHRPMEAMGALLVAVGDLVRAFTDEVLGDHPAGRMASAMREVHVRRAPCARAAHRQTLEGPTQEDHPPGGKGPEWMSYTALLVQVDRIVDDLGAPLPDLAEPPSSDPAEVPRSGRPADTGGSMGATLLEQVDGLADLVESQVPQMEEDRRLTDDVVAAIRATGLNRAWVPADLGGDERHVVEVIEAIERIAAVDGSTGWCAAIGSGSNLFAGYLPQSVASEVWSDPDQGNAGMFGPFGNVRANGDGLTLTGRWPFCSNSLHSAWIGLGAFWFGDADEAEPIPRLVLVPMDDVTIDPTWDAPGLCATGSHHATVDGAPVERDRSVSFVDPAWAEGPLWRLPIFCLLAPGLGVAPLGIARGALDEIAAAIEGKAGGTRGTLADDPIGLADFATADAALRGARAALWDACNRAWDCAERGERVPKVLQAQVMLAMNYGCQVAVDVTSTAHRLGGGRAAYAGSSLLRRLHDVQTARQHIMFGQSHRPIFAKTLAGEDTFAPPFIV